MLLQEKIYKLRKQSGFSQEDLAERIGVSRQAVQKWESGSASPDIANLAALCDTFHVTMDSLVHEESEPAPREAEGFAPMHPAAQTYRRQYVAYEYTSKTHVMGLPLVHINVGFGFRKAKGIIAVGNVALGILAIGALPVGILSLGALSVGVIAFGGLALGLMAAGGFALSLLMSLGGIAASLGYSLGGLAIAGKDAFGGLAVAGRVAVGDRAIGGLPLEINKAASPTAGEAVAMIRAAYPEVREWVLRLVRVLMG